MDAKNIAHNRKIFVTKIIDLLFIRQTDKSDLSSKRLMVLKTRMTTSISSKA